MPFWSEIPGRPETQVGRWRAMRKKGDEESSLGWTELALLEEENVDWEGVWSCSVSGDASPASLRELRCVYSSHSSVIQEFGSDCQTCTPSSL